MTLFLTSPRTETRREKDRTPNQGEPLVSPPADSRRHQSATAGADYFSTNLRNAVPLDRHAEYEITSRIEHLSRSRAETILGFPVVLEEVLRRVKHHIDAKNEGGAILERCGTHERLLEAHRALGHDFRALADGALSSIECNDRLNSSARNLLSDTTLQSTRIIGATAIERYRHLIEEQATGFCNTPGMNAKDLLFRTVFDTRVDNLRNLEAELHPYLGRLVQANLRLVLAVASRFHAHGELREELIAAGNLALTRCARDFKASVGVRFSTYAFTSIEHAMIESITERGRRARTISLNHVLSTDDDSRELIHTIPDPTCVDPHDMVAATDHTTRSQSILARALADIPADERLIIERSFGLNGFNAQSIRTIASELAQTPEYIRTRLERGKMRLHQAISMMDDWITLDPPDETDPAPSHGSQPLQYFSRAGSRAPHPVDDKELHNTGRETNRSVPSGSARMIPTPKLFTLTERYTAELTLIRRGSGQESSEPALRQRCLDHLQKFHDYLTSIWPVGHSEHRYGFQLEGEMLSLKKCLTADQLEAIEAAIQVYRTAIEDLHGERRLSP